VQFIDSQFTLPSTIATFNLFHSQIIVSNSVQSSTLEDADGIVTNGYVNGFGLFNGKLSFDNTNVLSGSTVTLGSGTLTVSNNLNLSLGSSVLNYYLGTNAATVAVTGNLTLGGTINVTDGGGFTNQTYSLLTYGQSLSGSLPTLGTLPAGYNYALSTSTANQVNLLVTSLMPAIPANLTAVGTNLLIELTWNASASATSYNVERSLVTGGSYSNITNIVATNYADGAVVPGTTYYYVVAATNSAGASGNSTEASAVALPSTATTNMAYQVSGDQLQISWPQDHLGWELQMQTNAPGSGLGTNWVMVPGSTNITSTNILIGPTQGDVFLRMAYP